MRNKFELHTHFTKAVSDEEGVLRIKGYANTTTKDRMGDVIPMDAWTKSGALENFLKNPIVLAYHDHSQPIGKVVDYSITSKGLEIVAEISKAAGNVADLIIDEVLKTFSIGFSIKDAEYDRESDIFTIKDLELFEVSVVSVPANQDSTFSVAKSLDTADLDELKTKYGTSEVTEAVKAEVAEDINNKTAPVAEEKEELEMDKKELEALLAKTAADAATAVTAKIEAKKAEEKAALAAETKKQEEAEKTKNIAIEAGATGAERLMADIAKKMEDETASLKDIVNTMGEELKAKSDEIEAMQRSKMTFADHKEEAIAKESAEKAYLLGIVLRKNMFDTKYGAGLVEKVNTSSSAQVSSDKYEQEVSTNLERDIYEKLVVAPMFRSIDMNQATMVLPIAPDAAMADWVAASTYGADATTGGTKTTALTEILLQTYKMASKSFLTDETDEDAIIPLLPLIRDGLVRGHARATEDALLNADSTVSPTTGPFNGLIKKAGTNVNAVKVGTTGTAKIIAKDLLETRRKLGKWGLDLSSLTCIVSQEVYWDLLEDDNFAHLNEVNGLATKISGQVGSMYGMPVVVSPEMPAKADGAAGAVIVATSNFVMPRIRGLRVQSDYYVEKQQQVIVATQRFGFSDIIAGQAVVAMTYDYSA